MQTSQFSLKKSSCLLLALAIAAFSLIIISSCNEKNKSEGKSTPFKMNCVTLTKAQIKTWADSGWFNPGNPNRIKYVLVQFYSSNSDKSHSNMQLVAFPCKSIGEVNINGKIVLNIDKSCAGTTFPGPVMFASSYLCTEEIGLTAKDGSLNNNVNNIKLVPSQDYSPYVGFSALTEISGGLVDTTKNPWPCPPYCCPGPCCPIKDTLIEF